MNLLNTAWNGKALPRLSPVKMGSNLTMEPDVSFIVDSQKTNLIDPDWDNFPSKYVAQSDAMAPARS